MKKLNIEIADSPALLAHGLMHRDTLESDAGMLFKFPTVVEASFWGKNTYIPLDVAFVNKESRIIDIKTIVPLSTRTVRSSGLCNMAIEANAGFFNKNEIKVGDSIEIISNVEGKETEILFHA